MADDSAETDDLLRKAAQGDLQSWGALLEHHRDRLRRMVALRLDARIRARFDPSDVLQEAFLEASRRLTEYVRDPRMPFFLWLRFLTGQKLAQLHRQHLGTHARNATREADGNPHWAPEASSIVLAARLIGAEQSPSQAAIADELKSALQQVLESLEPQEREVLAMRHFEQLSRAEIALVLGVSEAAAGKRYLRALQRLKQQLRAKAPQLLEIFQP